MDIKVKHHIKSVQFDQYEPKRNDSQKSITTAANIKNCPKKSRVNIKLENVHFEPYEPKRNDSQKSITTAANIKNCPKKSRLNTELDSCRLKRSVSVTSNCNDNCKNKKIKHILILCTDLAERPRSRHVVDAAVALKKLGYKVSIITSSYTPNNYEVDFSQFKVHEVGTWVPRAFYGWCRSAFYVLRSIYITVWMLLALADVRPKPCLVFVDANYLVLPLLKTFTDYKVISFQFRFELSRRHLPASQIRIDQGWLIKQSLLNADEIIVPNKVFSDIYKRSFKMAKIAPVICQPYINTTQLQNQKPIQMEYVAARLFSDTLIFLVLGEYHIRSNFDLVLEAFYLTLHNVKYCLRPRLQLVFSGHCSKNNRQQVCYYKRLVRRVKKLNLLGHVTFSKRFAPSYKKMMMTSCIAVVDPTVDEIFNRHILEAMALGRPILATDTGFTKEVLEHGVTGYLVPPSPNQFAKVMINMVQNEQGSENIGKHAHMEFLGKYTMEAYAARLNQIVVKHTGEVKSISVKLCSKTKPRPKTVTYNL